MALTYSLQRQRSERSATRTVLNRAVKQHLDGRFLLQMLIVFVAYLVAGKLGQATANIRSSNLGPVWPAYGIALAAILICGYRVWPVVAAAAFLVAFSSPVPYLTALGQAAGATVAALTGAFLLRRLASFHNSVSRLRDTLALILLGALGSATVSASIGTSVLYATHLHAYAGLGSAWVIYWLGDATGVLLITPLVLTLPSLRIRDGARVTELAVLLLLLTTACFVVFGDLHLFPVRLHVLAFAVLPFVMWAAIRFGVGAATVSTLIIAAIATIETAVGSGPFASNTQFINAVLLDIFFGVLSVTGLTLAAAIAESEQAEREREHLIGEQEKAEARLRLAAIVESSEDAIIGKDIDGIVTDWNKGAERLYGYSACEAIGKNVSFLCAPGCVDDVQQILKKIRNGEGLSHYETVRQRKDGTLIEVALTVSPIVDGQSQIVGASAIARDITERRRAEAALSDMSHKLIEAQEQERARIARELHDDINQRLAMLAIELENQEDRADLSPEVRSRMRALREQTTQISADVQAVSHELHSARLEYLGLAGGMKGWCNELGERQRIEINFRSHTLASSPPQEVSTCLFRVLQEAVHNATKHSGVRHIDVELGEDSGGIHLIVSDSGRGFDVDGASQGKGLGLTSMRERVRLVNGTIAIDSKPMGGTTICVRVPFRSDHGSDRAA